MSACSRYELLQWCALAIMLIASAFTVGACYYARRAQRHMRTADSQRMERDLRRAGIDAQVFAVLDSKPQIHHRRRTEAIDAARHDYRTLGRARANPHAKHGKEFAVWAIEYAAEWNALFAAGEPRGNGQTPGAHGFTPPPPAPPRPVDSQEKGGT